MTNDNTLLKQHHHKTGEMFGYKRFTFGRVQIKSKLIFQFKLTIDTFVYDIDGQLLKQGILYLFLIA